MQESQMDADTITAYLARAATVVSAAVVVIRELRERRRQRDKP
jgi:hypothetical protein